MKKIFALWIMVALLLMFVNVTAGAEEIDPTTEPDTDTVTETVEEETPSEEETAPETETDTEGEPETDTEAEPETVPEIDKEAVEELGTEIYNSIFTRVYDFFEQNKETIIMVSGFIRSIILAVAENRRKKKADNDMGTKQAEILADILGVTNSQNGVIDVANALIAGYAEMKEKYQQYETVEDDRNKLVGAVMVMNETILDILATVYANSNLPQGVKDTVTLKYARCNKALDQDDKLKALVTAVQDILKKDENEEKEA